MVSLAALRADARRRLREAGIETPELDARLLVEHVTGASRTEMVLDGRREVGAEAAAALGQAIARRISGEPVHRILGWREFHGLRLALSPATLEPRPDTETLVDLALPEAREIAAGKGSVRILDLGTGTGAIALALLAQLPEAVATATDLSEEALETARRNAEALGMANRFTLVRSDWFAGVAGRFDLIVSNPPYVDADEMSQLAREVRDHDPHLALSGGHDGLDAYRAIALGAAAHLVPGGAVAVEIGHRQKAAVTALFEEKGFRLAAAAKDLGRRDRALLFAPLALAEPRHK